MWTKQPTDEVVRLIEWIEYPQNTSLMRKKPENSIALRLFSVVQF